MVLKNKNSERYRGEFRIQSNMLDETFGENSLLFSQKSSYVRLTGF